MVAANEAAVACAVSGGKRRAVFVVEDVPAFAAVIAVQDAVAVVQRQQLAAFVVVADAFVSLARAAVGVVRLGDVRRLFALDGEAAIVVVVEAAGGGTVAVLPDSADAAVGLVPDDFAVHGGGREVAQAGAFF